MQSRSKPPPNHLKFVSIKEDSYDDLSYNLLHMEAWKGWRFGLHTHQLVGDAWQQNPNKFISALDFCRYQAHVHDPIWIGDVSTFDIQKYFLFHGGLLTHQYFVDQYIKVEENNLEFLRFNQNKLKAALYNGLDDAVAQGGEGQEGRYVILPLSHAGSPRQKNQCFQDAMAWVRRWEKNYNHDRQDFLN